MTARRPLPWGRLAPALGLVLLLLCLHVVPAARDEALLRDRLAEALVLVNQSRAIQQLASKLCAELGREHHLALFGAQARAAARAALSALVTDPSHGCLSWDPSIPGNNGGGWVATTTSVRDALSGAFARQRGDPRGKEVFVVIENMDRVDCSNLIHLNNLMSAMDRDVDVFPNPPTFLFLFESDVPARVSVERGVRSHWAEHYDARCNPGPALNLRAFFGRLTPVTFEPLPAPTTPEQQEPPRDTAPICKGLRHGTRGSGSGSGGGFIETKILVLAAVGLAAAAGIYAVISRLGGGSSSRSSKSSRDSDAAKGKAPVAAAARAVAASSSHDENGGALLAARGGGGGGGGGVGKAKKAGAGQAAKDKASPSPPRPATRPRRSSAAKKD